MTNENVRKIKFESIDKKFGGGLVYFPDGSKGKETIIPVKAIDVSNSKKVKLVSLTPEEEAKCLTFSKLVKPVCDKIRKELIKLGLTTFAGDDEPPKVPYIKIKRRTKNEEKNKR